MNREFEEIWLKQRDTYNKEIDDGKFDFDDDQMKGNESDNLEILRNIPV